jgi:hypothetical protein
METGNILREQNANVLYIKAAIHTVTIVLYGENLYRLASQHCQKTSQANN